MGHVGLTPQSVNTLGGYKVQGRGHLEADRIARDAEALAGPGHSRWCWRKLPSALGQRITREIAIPTIGIGTAGVECDGQVLVVDDMLGLFADFRPKFVKRYGELGGAAVRPSPPMPPRSAPAPFRPEHSFGETTRHERRRSSVRWRRCAA